MTRNSIRMIHAALDEDEGGTIILRGVISPESLENLKVAPYQREILPISKIHDLMKAFEVGGVPDIDLGMRGGSFLEKDNSFYLQNDVYVVDGLQRVTAARQVLADQGAPRLGATIHFNTTEDWERARFKTLNSTATKLSPNILIRNMQQESPIVEMLYLLCKDKSFALHEKVCWQQRMKRDELISVVTFLQSSAFLMSRFGTGTRSTRFKENISGLQRVMDKIGRTTCRDNIKAFWDLLDECFNIKLITFREGASFLKTSFVFTLATILTEHANFWSDARLSVPRDLRKKIALFPIKDPEIARLVASSGNTSKDILYQIMVKHINSGKRTKRLVVSRREHKGTKIVDETPFGKLERAV